MGTKITIKTLLENSADGTITARQITESGMHRSVLQKYENNIMWVKRRKDIKWNRHYGERDSS